MPPVGRPPSRTSQGIAAPITEMGVPDLGLGGFGGPTDVLTGANSPWRMFVDEREYVPELVWPNSIPVFDQMRTDSQLAGLLTATMWGITQLRFVVDPNGCPESMVREMSEDLNIPVLGEDDKPRARMKGRFVHSKHVFDAMLAAIYGHYHFEQVVRIVDGKARLRKLAPRPPQTIKQLNVADDGGLVSLEQWHNLIDLRAGTTQRPPIPVDRLVSYVFQQEGKSQIGRSMLRDVYKDWLIKDRNIRVEVINHSRAGGVPYAVAPMGSTDADVERLHQMMRRFQIGEDSGAAVPYGTELKIAAGKGSDIDATIKRIDESMARRFLLQLMNLAQGGTNVGSYALSENFEDSFLVGQRVIAQWYCDITTEHVIEDLIDWNYGEDTPLAPRITWERSTEDSLGVEPLAQLVDKGIIIVDDELEDHIRYRYLLPKRSAPRADLQQQEAEATAPPQPELPPAAAQPAKPKQPVKASGSPGLARLPARPSTPPVRASWNPRTWFSRKPDVMASGPHLVTVPNVPILEVGVEYLLSTGATTFTPDDLKDVVMAANEDSAIPQPRLGIGHIDPRYNDIKTYDGSPSFGKASNLRLSENGMTVYADYVGVPKWLADIMPYAFPSRSIEGFWNVESQRGKKYNFVLSACKVLGVQWPGISDLEDLPQLPQYYGEEMPESVVIDADLAEAMAAAKSQPGGDPVKTAASADLDNVRRAFYDEYVKDNSEALWWWIRQVLTDPNELVVEDDQSGQLYKVPFSSDGSGNVSFSDATAVRIEYVPDGVAASKAAAPHVAATLAIGRTVLASYNNRDESVPEETGGRMDPKEIRQRLNLPEDASDEQVKETLAALNTAVTGDAPPAVEVPAAAPSASVEPPAAVEQPAAAAAVEEPPAPVAVAASGQPGVVMVDAEAWASMEARVAASTALVENTNKAAREGLVAAAIGDGRIPSARREHWVKLLEVDFEGNSATLASLAKGVVPVEGTEVGHGVTTEGEQQQVAEETVTSWTQQLFPETRPPVAAAAPQQDPRIVVGR